MHSVPFHATGAATASRLFNEALAKIAMNAQQSGTGDIGKTRNPLETPKPPQKPHLILTILPFRSGSALMSVVNVNKEIQEQQMNIVSNMRVLPFRESLTFNQLKNIKS